MLKMSGTYCITNQRILKIREKETHSTTVKARKLEYMKYIMRNNQQNKIL